MVVKGLSVILMPPTLCRMYVGVQINRRIKLRGPKVVKWEKGSAGREKKVRRASQKGCVMGWSELGGLPMGARGK